jgi:hypothetical protein
LRLIHWFLGDRRSGDGGGQKRCWENRGTEGKPVNRREQKRSGEF